MSSGEKSRGFVGQFAREPLVHFLLIGACIYALFAFQGQRGGEEKVQDQTVVVTAGEIAWLEDSWAKRWNRPPTPRERQGLISEHVKETILYREALAMGLDKDDIVIRRRLGQKLRFVAEDLIRPQPPTDMELEEFFQENVDRYSVPAQVTMTHVFLDPDKRGNQTLEDAEAVMAELAASDQPVEAGRGAGDTFFLQAYYPERTESEIARDFGHEFARSIFELEPNKWHGPVLSGYGVHLVYLSQRTETRPMTLPEVKDRVSADWEEAKRSQLNEAFIAGVVERYEVVVEETPKDSTGAAVVEPTK